MMASQDSGGVLAFGLGGVAYPDFGGWFGGDFDAEEVGELHHGGAERATDGGWHLAVFFGFRDDTREIRNYGVKPQAESIFHVPLVEASGSTGLVEHQQRFLRLAR